MKKSDFSFLKSNEKENPKKGLQNINQNIEINSHEEEEDDKNAQILNQIKRNEKNGVSNQLKFQEEKNNHLGPVLLNEEKTGQMKITYKMQKNSKENLFKSLVL